jgi:hypothetical protein
MSRVTVMSAAFIASAASEFPNPAGPIPSRHRAEAVRILEG